MTWIADGDTIQVDTENGVVEVRLLGINTPENDECYGEESLEYLVDNLKGTTVGLQLSGEDQFGRALASVWQEDELINLTLVSNGHAIALTPEVSDPYSSILLEAEQLAFDSGEGLWSPVACGGVGEVADVRFDIDASQFNPPGPDDDALDDEYIVIVNDGSEAIQLKGWTLRDESSRNRLAFDGSVTLASGERLTIASGCSTDPGWCGTTPIWNNDGDMALLLDEAGRVVARARY
ncbi:MAG TPA: lamin tail domain-containing protein [Acidimicrobiia bacterium]